MSEAPVLSTVRFDLFRPRGSDDLEGLCRLVADEETRRHLGTVDPSPRGQWERLMRNAGSWRLYGYGTFYVRPRGREEIVGNCGVFHSWRGLEPRMDDQPEAGWIVRRDWWGLGLASEVMQAAFDWFDHEHGPRRIVAMIERGNSSSERVAARFGFTRFAEQSGPESAPIDFYERLTN